MCCRKIIVVLVFVSFSLSANAQIKSIGVPFIKNYERSDYGAATQNWDIVQNEDGIMYFANNNGVLEFDGTNWKIYPISNLSVPRCLHIGKDRKLWVGAANEFGYLKATKTGEFSYISISDLVPEGYENFSEIWKIYESDAGIYFQAFEVLFFYDYEKIKVIEDFNDYHFSFYVNNRLFIQDRDEGLKELRGERLYLIEGGEKFKEDMEVWQMIPFSIDTILIATQRDGLFLYDGYKIQSYDFKLNNYLIDKQIFSLQKIQDKYLAFGTIQSGLLVTDFKGNLIQHIDKSKGLQNNTILSLFEDKSGHIWLGLDNGIDFVEINSAFTFLNDALGIEGTGYTAKLFNNNLYLGTNQGLYYKTWDDINKTDINEEKFSIVENTFGQVWKLQQVGETLFCGHNTGTFVEKNGQFEKISEENGGWTYTQWSNDENLLIGGTYSNLTKYVKNNDHWLFEKAIPGLHESCRQVCIDSLDNVWISHGSKGIYKVRLSPEKDSVVSFKLYNGNNGLPSAIGNYVHKLFNQVIFCANKGVFQYNYSTDRFEPSSFFNKLFGENNRIRYPEFDEDGNLWFYKNDYPAMLEKAENGWQATDASFHKYGNIYVNAFENLEIIDASNVLFGTEKGFIHFNPQLVDTSKIAFKTLIRSVEFTEASDSLLYSGGINTVDLERTALPYKMNAMKFNFAAPVYESPERTEYRFKLEGFDKQWSGWSTNTTKEYTNIPPGSYTFEVESKDIYENIGEKASFSFVILPPWYSTYWAYIGYFVLLVFSVLYIMKYLEGKFNDAKVDLKRKEQEKLKKKEEEFARENLLNEQKIIKLKNEKLETEVLQQKTETEMKNKELASVAMQITHKNEILGSLKSKIETLSEKVNTQAQKELKQLIKTIDEDLKLDEDWNQFKKHFEEVHANFFKRLREDYKELTPKDLKMCAYLRMNLSTKEIAPLMNISVRGVEISRYRLRKKLGLQKDANLIEFMLNV
jgi:DNA-binding CsgD family transcriptional regulator